MKKVMLIIGAIAVFILIVWLVLFFTIFSGTEKLVCKSNEGNITLRYNEETIVGYTASGITYDLDNQKEYAEQIGVDAYLDEFSEWFSNNTTGTCTR